MTERRYEIGSKTNSPEALRNRNRKTEIIREKLKTGPYLYSLMGKVRICGAILQVQSAILLPCFGTVRVRPALSLKAIAEGAGCEKKSKARIFYI